MITITEALIAEHSAFCAAFAAMERVLPSVSTLNEVKMLAGQLETMMAAHTDAETDLALVALDHVLEQRGKLDHLHEDHRDMDTQLKRAQMAASFDEGLYLLKEALLFSRLHFQHEEQVIFPLIDQVLPRKMLEELGHAWLQRYLKASRPAATTSSVAWK